MKYILYLLLFCLSLLTACFSSENEELVGVEEEIQEDIEPQYFDYECDIATIALQIEESVGFEVKPTDYELIQLISADVYDNIKHQQVYSQEEALEVLRLIHQTIGKYMASLSTYHSIFSTCLRYRIFDCDILSFLYLSVAENLGIPLYGMLTPSHMFIVWEDPKRSFRVYWETTEGRAESLKHYLDRYHFAHASMGKGMNFKLLEKEELIGVIYFNIAKEYTDMQKKYDISNEFCYASLKRAPEWTSPLQIIANNYFSMGVFDSSIRYCEKEILVYGNIYESNYLLAKSYEKIGCINEALEKYRFSLSLLSRESYKYDSKDLLEDIERLSNI